MGIREREGERARWFREQGVSSRKPQWRISEIHQSWSTVALLSCPYTGDASSSSVGFSCENIGISEVMLEIYMALCESNLFQTSEREKENFYEVYSEGQCATLSKSFLWELIYLTSLGLHTMYCRYDSIDTPIKKSFKLNLLISLQSIRFWIDRSLIV
jgi:hypothetical protein